LNKSEKNTDFSLVRCKERPPASLKFIGTDAFAGNELIGITVAEDSSSLNHLQDTAARY